MYLESNEEFYMSTNNITRFPVVTKLAMNVLNENERNSVYIFDDYISSAVLQQHVEYRLVVVAMCCDWLPF